MPLIDPVTMSNPSSASVPGSISQPITLLGTDLSKVFRHIHPVLLLSIYGQRFSNLIADPVQSLLITLLPIAVVQIAYCAICLPGSGAGTRTPKKIQKSKIGGKKAVSTETGAEKIVVSIISSLTPVEPS
jgi:phosphatidylinositol glycan class F